MRVRDIPHSEWQEFLGQFSRGHRAWLATIASQPAEGPPHVTGIERPLSSVTPVVHANLIVGIDIQFQDDAETVEPVRITTPVAIRVDETTEGTARGLEILDKDGGWTRLRFRAAPMLEMLDGVAPGELR